MDLLAEIAEAELMLANMPDTSSEQYFFGLINLLQAGKKVDLSHLTTLSFPQKLFLLLQFDDSGTAEWCNAGQAFRILHKEKFMNDVVPHYFNRTILFYFIFFSYSNLILLLLEKEFRSFERQLNVYGFGRFRMTESKYCYRHNQFHREHPEFISALCRKPPKFRRGPCKKTVDRRTQERHHQNRVLEERRNGDGKYLTRTEDSDIESEHSSVEASSGSIAQQIKELEREAKRHRANPDSITLSSLLNMSRPIKQEITSTQGHDG